MIVDIASEIVEVGRTEDGAPYTAPVYFVIVVEEATGKRWRHFHNFASAKVRWIEGMTAFPANLNAEDEAMALANRVRAEGLSLEAVKTSSYWSEWLPVYGSAAYDEGEAVAWERELSRLEQ